MSIKVATVCTGVGAPEQAIKELGWKHSISFGCEIDKYARTTYQANFEPHTMFEDMTKESWIGEQYESDLFVGGIPCQAFSLAGKRLGELDPRGLLFYNFYDYVKKQRPKVFIIENVKGLLSDDNGKTFQNWIQLLGKSVNTQGMMFPHPDSLEYNLHWTVLNAKDFGLPQNRERVFLVGIRPDLPNTFRFPIGWNLDLRLKDVLESNVDEKYYLSDKMLNYLNTRKDNFNGGKINYKYGNDVASCINASSKSLDISDNIIVEGVVNDKGKLRKVSEATCLDSSYAKGMDNHAQRTMISEEIIPVRMVGRNPDNPKSRKTGEYREQTIERYEEGIFGTLTTVQKDNLILVGGIKEGLFQEGGKTEDYPQAFRVYDEEGISSTLSACGGGMGGKTGLYQIKQINPSKESNGVQPYQQNRVYDSEGIMPALTSELSGRNNVQVIVKEGTKKGYAIAQEGDSINLQYPESNTRKGRVGKQIAQTIDTGSNQYVVEKRIRRLTPRECFRLQGFPDYFDISHVSETQAYKQAGNSIPVSVLKEIFKNLTPILQ
jgi:DNA (cytosine-5)-methyltransferase 1